MTTEYYIQSIDGNTHTVTNEVRDVSISVDFEVGEATVENNHLTSECSLDLHFRDPDNRDPEDGFDSTQEPEYGTLSLEFIVQVEDDPEFLTEQAERWNEEGYEAVDPKLISHVESDILPSLLVPIDQLLGNGFRGIIPQLRFTISAQEREEMEEDTNDTENGDE